MPLEGLCLNKSMIHFRKNPLFILRNSKFYQTIPGIYPINLSHFFGNEAQKLVKKSWFFRKEAIKSKSATSQTPFKKTTQFLEWFYALKFPLKIKKRLHFCKGFIHLRSFPNCFTSRDKRNQGPSD